MKPVAVLRAADLRIRRALAGTEGFDQPAVLHARRAGRFATATIEAQVEMFLDARTELEPAVDHRAHEVNPPARAVVLVARFQIRRTGRRAQTAMHAVEKLFVLDLAPDAR